MAERDSVGVDGADDGTERSTGIDRRRFVQRAGLGVAAAWAAPVVLSGGAHAQGSPTTTTTGPTTTLPIPGSGWVAVGGDGGGRTFSSSDDGANWPLGTNPIVDGEVHAAAYSPLSSVWVAVGRSTTSVALLRSTDNGASWTPIGPSPTGRLLEVATDGAGNWVTLGEAQPGVFPGDGLVLYSTDNGASWQAASVPAGVNTLHGLATDGTTWVAGGQDDIGAPILMFSTDGGATWSAPIVMPAQPAPPAQGHVFDIATNGAGRWLAVGALTFPGDNYDVAIWYVDGGPITAPGDWTLVTGPFGTGFLTGVASDKGSNFVAVGRQNSPTGPGFSFVFTPTTATPGIFSGSAPQNLHGVATDQAGTWIAVGSDASGMRTWTSGDGVNWAAGASPGGGVLFGVAAPVVA